tara:strand:+ start:322 stop:480 length:159 start_codon:yes stop_codon:yes gene_type:complete
MKIGDLVLYWDLDSYVQRAAIVIGVNGPKATLLLPGDKGKETHNITDLEIVN